MSAFDGGAELIAAACSLQPGQQLLFLVLDVVADVGDHVADELLELRDRWRPGLQGL
jgi:hypothetical protein